MAPRICFVQPHLEIGGAERQTVWLANKLSARGYDVEVLLFEAKGALLEQLDPAVVVRAVGRDSHARIVGTALSLRRALAMTTADVYIVKLWSGILATSLANLGSARDAKTVYYEDLEPIGHIRFVRFGRLKRILVGFAYRRHAGPIVANSSGVAANMRRAYSLPSTPPVIHPLVDVPPGHPHYFDGLPRPVILTVGSLIPRKGLDLISQAMSRQQQECSWVVVGDGPMREDLQALDLGRVTLRLTGEVASPYALMRGADLLLHYPRSEAYGVVVAEALAVSLPVLAADVHGPREIANRYGGTRLIPACDVDALERQIKEFLEHYHLGEDIAWEPSTPDDVDDVLPWELEIARLVASPSVRR